MLRLLRNEKVRDWFVQAVVAVTVVTMLVSFFVIGKRNLEKNGVTSGFDFLDRSTGWDITFSLFEYSIRDPYWWVILIGITNTLFIGLLGIALATVVGVLIGIGRLSSNLVVNTLATAWVELFRNIPLILQAFFWYAVVTHFPSPRQSYAIADMVFLSNRGLYVPTLNISSSAFLAIFAAIVIAAALLVIGLRGEPSRARRRASVLGALAVMAATVAWTVVNRIAGSDSPVLDIPYLKGLNFRGGSRLPPEFTALLIAMVIFGSAYIGEIVRAGFMSVPKGILEGAESVGLPRWVIYWKVRIPLALRSVVPPLGNQYVFLMKATTIGIAIGFNDLFMVISTSINQSGQTIELLLIMMTSFLLINYSIASLMNALNRALALKGYENKN